MCSTPRNVLQQITQQVGLGSDIAGSEVILLLLAPKPLEKILSDPALQYLRAFLSDVGFELLKSTKGVTNAMKWTEPRCKDYALGYGGLEQLLVMAYNTPTATITALWKAGKYEGASWIPLFQRRGEESPPLPLIDWPG